VTLPQPSHNYKHSSTAAYNLYPNPHTVFDAFHTIWFISGAKRSERLHDACTESHGLSVPFIVVVFSVTFAVTFFFYFVGTTKDMFHQILFAFYHCTVKVEDVSVGDYSNGTSVAEKRKEFSFLSPCPTISSTMRSHLTMVMSAISLSMARLANLWLMKLGALHVV